MRPARLAAAARIPSASCRLSDRTLLFRKIQARYKIGFARNDPGRRFLRDPHTALRAAFTSDIHSGTPAKIIADPTRLRQILLNLLGNAAKFTPSGVIEPRVGPAPAGNALRLDVIVAAPADLDVSSAAKTPAAAATVRNHVLVVDDLRSACSAARRSS